MDPGPERVVSFLLDAVIGGTWRRDEFPRMYGSGGQICKDHSCTLAPLMHCTAHMILAAIGCEKVQGGLVGLPHKQEAVEVFVDLRVEPHVCTETLPTVIGELVRMLPTVGLVRRADYPQCEGSVLPRDSCLGFACTMEASLSH